MKDKRNYHGAVGKSCSEQQFRKSDEITLPRYHEKFDVSSKSAKFGHQVEILLLIACHTIGSYGRLAMLADEIQLIFEIFKIHYRSKITSMHSSASVTRL